MRLTMPQIIMLNHAAWVNGKRLESSTGNNSNANDTSDNDVVFNGKRLDELNTDEMVQYYGNWG